MNNDTRMYREAAQAPEVVRRQTESNAASLRALGEKLRERAPRAVVTCARGSSDHAATFARYLIETHLGILTSSASPSLSSVYETDTNLADAVFLVISQSGKSPDLLAAAERAKASGAYVVALCNTPDAPLTKLAHHSIDLRAGAETSVAATKSYIASLSAIIHVVAEWTRNQELIAALAAAPAQLQQAWAADWSAAIPHLRSAINLFVVGRGYGLGIAQEAALKFKETSGLHAEGFSSAEVQHGPMALVRAGFPVLAFSQSDETRKGIETLAKDFLGRSATVLLAGGNAPGAVQLPVVAAHPVIEPMLMILSFYRMVASLAIARGFDPDVPPHLRKVTETV
ncbi:glucosamine--fructose-6-phosphate aminotransferase (isomerizing) [Povalibacter uvarum]|uniref:Glucosamine--fructose-6-phosphate aminotransferase (Isomerizing) n=2 Tax=Povalibacter uvarum TaxID=732238 RepID=A0A841HVG7_9GAMM|nr:SIS domain-containing protein [Povalibacter uvarum]MBB6095952.1 glucosamine--fructose-6-phosphate aminotransferase (isomerizing) [Povalibacter uvarum]